MKIAVPVEDENLQVFTRVGRAPFFAIFENDRFKGLRVNHHAASHHEEEEGHGHGEHKRSQGAFEPYSKEEVEHHRKDLHNLDDIDVMLVRAVGPNMKEALELSGIRVVKVRKKDGERADRLVQNFLAASGGDAS